MEEASFSGKAKICEKNGRGMILPLTEAELDLPNGLRGFIYAFAMIYFFLGVSIVAEIFMGAIEAVTSRKKQVRLKNGRAITLRVWNDTVANLTLMALGSSAPEIMLSVLELIKNDMYAGELGPSTIVGSAAFNLLVIVAVCIVAIPSQETRKVKETTVFLITLVFSLFAYLWLVFILNVITPDVIDLWEALVTFFCFPTLVWISWLADVGKCGGLTRTRQAKVQFESGCPPEEIVQRVCDILGQNDEDTQMAVSKCIAANPHYANLGSLGRKKTEELRDTVDEYRQVRSKSRAARRIEATRTFTGAKRASRRSLTSASSGGGGGGQREEKSSACQATIGMASVVQFVIDQQSMDGHLFEKKVLVSRGGDCVDDLIVEYSVHSVVMEMPREPQSEEVAFPVATPGQDIRHGTFVLEADQKCKCISVSRPIFPSGASQDFMVCLRHVEAKHASGVEASIGAISSVHVVVTPDSGHGNLSFTCERLAVLGSEESQLIEVLVRRTAGCSGCVSCSYHTERLTSIPGFDYVETEGTLEFVEGQTEQVIEIEILKKSENEAMDTFLVVLTEATGGARFDSSSDGGNESGILTVEIMARDVSRSASGKVVRSLDRIFNFDKLRLGNQECAEQFWAALYCNGGPEEQAEATKLDWVFHLVALPWKLLFTVVPPTSFCGGWLCFCVSLGLIGFVTMFIGDLAELFGCVLDVPDAVTAISFVALGTSMPDLFASQTAAVQDATADASIVNVTGSNSVNVFLGLGLPWSLGALYWMFADADQEWIRRYPEVAKEYLNTPVFVVPSNNLGFSVLVFSCCSIAGMIILTLRRRQVGGELGGPLFLKIVNAFSMVLAWLAFIALSSWQVLRDHKASAGERWSVMFGVSFPTCCCVGLSAILLLRYKAKEAVEDVGSPSLIASEKMSIPNQIRETSKDVGLHADYLESSASCRAENTDEEPPQTWFVSPPHASAAPLCNGTQFVVDLLEEGCGYDCNAEHDMIPVQPMSTPSVPPLMSEPALADMTQTELFAYSMHIWNQNEQTPVALRPNLTQEAHKVEQRFNSPTPLLARSPDSSMSHASLGSSPTKQML